MKSKLLISLLVSQISLQSFGAPFEVVIETPKESIQGSHLKNSSVGLDRLTTEGAKDNDVLFFKGDSWVPAPLTGLRFRGGWDPNQNDPEILDASYMDNGDEVDAVTGDYFIVTQSVSDESWNRGDWIVYNGKAWERINNTGAVLSIFNRKPVVLPKTGDYTWEQIDKTGSSIFDLADVFAPLGDLTNFENYVLKWNPADKRFELKEDNIGMSGLVNSSQVMDGTIVDADISTNALIQVSKIDGYSGGLGKLKVSGGVVNNLKLDNKVLKVGMAGKVVIVDSSGGLQEIILSELKKRFDDVVVLFSTKEDRDSILSAVGGADSYLTGKVDSSTNARVWSNFNLDIATEGSTHKFQTDENVWNAKLNNYDVNNAPLPLQQVGSVDTVNSGLEKLEAQLDQGAGNILVHTPQILDKAIDYKKHFSINYPDSGFLFLGGADPKSWSIKMTSGLQFKGEKKLSEFPLPSPALSGDYFVISEGGDYNGTIWNIGDWAIYDGSSYLQINNTGKVLDFNGRKGTIGTCPDPNLCANVYDYSWKMLDLTGSKIQDIPDVPTPSSFNAPNGGVYHILKRKNNQWVLKEDLSGVAPGQSVSATSIGDGVVMDTHVGNSILIDQIQNLRADLDKLLDRTGGDVSGNIDLQGVYDLLGLKNIDGNDFGKVITYAKDYQTILDTKQDKLNINGDSSSVLIVEPTTSNKVAKKLDTVNLPEGSTNLYHTDQRVYDSLGAPSGSGSYSGVGNDINYAVSGSPDSIKVAFEKLNDKISNAGNLPANSVSGDALKEGSILPEKLAPANNEGETIIFRNGDWSYGSISGFQMKNTWDLGGTDNSSASAPDNDLVEGDYYIISADGKIDGEEYYSNDWAVYNGSGFSKISNAEYITSFNGRVGIINPTQDDYDWSKVVTGSDVTKEKISLFEDVEYTLGDNDADKKKLLAWDVGTSKWVPVDDKEGLSSSPVLSDFSVGANGQEKAVTNDDILSIAFSDIDGLQSLFDSNFINLSSDPVSFPSDINFDTNGAFSISGVGEIVNPNDGSNKFTPSALQTSCSALDPTIFEKNFSDENLATTDSRRVLNADKKFVKLTPENLMGSVATLLFDPSKVQNLPLTGFAQANAPYDLTPEDLNSPGSGTSLLEVFNKLAGKVNSFLNNESPGLEIATGGTIEINSGKNGKTIIVEETIDVNLLSSEISEITIKRVDSTTTPSVVNVEVDAGVKIDGKTRITLASNYSSVTLKKIEIPNGGIEFVILRQNGTIN